MNEHCAPDVTVRDNLCGGETLICRCRHYCPHLRDMQVHLVAIKVSVEGAAYALVEAKGAEQLDLGPASTDSCAQRGTRVSELGIGAKGTEQLDLGPASTDSCAQRGTRVSEVGIGA